MDDNTLYDDPDLAQFYDLASRTRDDFAFCTKLAGRAHAVLDLGCGTGTLAAQLADGRNVTGVDPAAAMLDIARARSGGDKVRWVEGDARTLRLDARFDLIILTGHSFQVFLTQQGQQAVLATIAAHLAPNGRFIFDSRNPAFKELKSRTTGSNIRQLTHPAHGEIEAWNESQYDATSQILSYQNGYRVLATDQKFSAKAKIRYTDKQELAAMIAAAGLAVEQWFGDWHGTIWTPDAREIIPLGTLSGT